jgi:pimeloyl-ACP methyl ester carboxylesterase
MIEVPTRVGPVPVRVTGEGPPVLAVHGLLVDGRLWDAVADLLAPHARLIAPDLPLGAHRRAVPDRARLTPPVVAQALVDVLDGLGVPEAVVVGNDTGGALAQVFAAAHRDRVRALVLAGCDAFEHFPPPLLRPVVPLAAVPGFAALLVRLLALPPLLARPGPVNLLTARGIGRARTAEWLAPARTDPGVRADLTAFVRSMRPDPLLDAVDGLRGLPGAVLWGRRERVFPRRDAERLADLLGTTVTWLDDALSFVPVDRPDAVAEAVRALLPTPLPRDR